jgi:hypothetical protein
VKIRLFFRILFLGLLAAGAVQAQTQAQPVKVVSTGGARVVTVEDAQSMAAFEPQPERVRAMVDRGVAQACGVSNVLRAWASLVSPQDIVGIKVVSTPGASAGTRPAVVQAVIGGLIESGVPATNIFIWDRLLADLRKAGFEDLARRLGVRVAGAMDEGFDEAVSYDDPVQGTLVWGDLEFDRKDAKAGRKSYISKLLTRQITKIITVSPLLNHHTGGINGSLCSLALGSADNTMRFESQPARMAKAVPEIYAMSALSDHVVLNIMDALIAQYEGEQVSLLHYASELKQIWVSKDPVALDVLGLAELARQREINNAPLAFANMPLYETAGLLELGQCDLKRIRVEIANIY